MPAIADTGPLVAFLDRAERHHRWIVALIEEIEAPLLVCEPVLAEAFFLVRHLPKAQDALIDLLQNGSLRIAFRLDEHVATIHQLLKKYRDVPMSLADACVVCLAEIYDRHDVLTLDSDFAVYRKHGRVPLRLIHPGMA